MCVCVCVLVLVCVCCVWQKTLVRGRDGGTYPMSAWDELTEADSNGQGQGGGTDMLSTPRRVTRKRVDAHLITPKFVRPKLSRGFHMCVACGCQ